MSFVVNSFFVYCENKITLSLTITANGMSGLDLQQAVFQDHELAKRIVIGGCLVKE